VQKDKNYFVHVPHSGLNIIESTRNNYFLNKSNLDFQIKKFSDLYTIG